LGILIASITNNQILYYFFSNNYMNLIILNLYNNIEINDSDIISYYINFLKSISMKIEKNIIKLFYNEKTNFFPLLDIIMTLYNHQDEMIKNVSRNIFLSIIKLNYEPSIDYICNLPQINYFILFMNKIENLIKNLFDIKNNSTNDKKDNLLKYNLFYYFQH
jgi:protein CLEC16A